MAMHGQDRAILKVSWPWPGPTGALCRRRERDARGADRRVRRDAAGNEEIPEIRHNAAYARRSADHGAVVGRPANPARAGGGARTYIDVASRDETEKTLIQELAKRLRLPEDDAKRIIGSAEARAKRLLTEYMGATGV